MNSKSERVKMKDGYNASHALKDDLLTQLQNFPATLSASVRDHVGELRASDNVVLNKVVDDVHAMVNEFWQEA